MHQASSIIEKNVENYSQFRVFAELINKAWDKKPAQFNEHYFRESISPAIMYKTVDRLVMKQEWY